MSVALYDAPSSHEATSNSAAAPATEQSVEVTLEHGLVRVRIGCEAWSLLDTEQASKLAAALYRAVGAL